VSSDSSKTAAISVSRRRLIRAGGTLSVALTLVTACTALALAQDPRNTTRADIDRWLAKYGDIKPDFKSGDVLTVKDFERIRPFMMPGYVEQFKFPQMRMEIIATRNHTPRKDYMDCTEKYQAQVRIDPDGSMENYVCGQPFADASLSVADPLSGYKAAWNFEARWWNYGPIIMNVLFLYDRFGGSHQGQVPKIIEAPPAGWISGVEYKSKLPDDAPTLFGGGGTFIKTADTLYERVYFSHLAPRAEEGGLLPLPEAKDVFYKEFSGFFAPFDLRGQVFITYRYNDPHRADDAWAYDPQSRRVRRVSVEVKEDQLGGSDQTNEDFYTFSDRIAQWKFKFLGWKDMLVVMDGKNDYGRFYGPDGNLPDDVWSIRRTAVIERVSKRPGHPYSSVVMFWDSENWHPWMAATFNREHKLWKTIVYSGRWTEDYKEWAEINHGVESTQLQGITATDFINQRATIFADFGSGYPAVNLEQVGKIFDISKLEQFHR
jgi:hypothetical protein